MQNPFAHLTPSQTWEQHLRNAGPTLGGVDYALAVGTPLPVLPGVREWVTPSTPLALRPAWYNTGLGNAAAYRYPTGTRTVYAHCSRVRSDGVVLSGNTGKVRGNGHVHVHDVLANGTTRARPFSTYAAGGAGGGGGAETPDEETPTMRDTQIYQMEGKSDWSRVGADVLPTAAYPGGYEATTDVEVARLWGRQIAGTGNPTVTLPRDEYIEAQQFGHREYLLHRADDIARIREALAGITPIDVNAQAEAVADELRDRLQE